MLDCVKKSFKDLGKKENRLSHMLGKIILGIALITLIVFLLIGSYKHTYVELETKFPNASKTAITVDSVISAPWPSTISIFTTLAEWIRFLNKIIEESMPDLCMVNGNVQVKISDDQVAYTYGEDRLIDANHREVKGFCIQKNDTEKIMKFVLENGEHIKEIVAIKRHDGQVIMKRPNGYIVTIVQNSK